MKVMVRSRLMVAAAAIAIAGALGSAPVVAQEPVRGGTLTVGFPADAKTFDPRFSVIFSERQVMYPVYNTLTKLGPDFSINPELATSWDVLDGGKRIVFKLRTGVKFHDGTDFNAEVVKWNIDSRLDEETKSPQRKQLVKVVESVDVVDEHTVAFNLLGPFPALMGMLGQRVGFMVSPAAAQKHGEEFGSNPVGTGPFIFKEWVRGSHVRLERNPNYWEDGLPYLDKIHYEDVAGSVVGIQRLATGELDYVGQLSPNDIRSIEGNDDVELHPVKVGRWHSLQWRWDRAPFNDANFRLAVAHAIDRKHIVDILTAGMATMAAGPTPPGLWWYSELEAFEHDPAKAKEYLSKSSYKPGTEVPLVVAGTGVYPRIGALVQEQLQAVGIVIQLQPVPQKGWYGKVLKGEFEFTPTRWTQRPDPDGLLQILFHTDGFANSTKYSNPKVDALLEQARTMTDIPKRKAIYAEAQQQIAADLPYVSLFFAVEYGATRKRVQDFEWIPDQIPRFRELWLSN